MFPCRLYEMKRHRREQARVTFRSEHPQWRGKRPPVFPIGIRELPKFSTWLKSKISVAYASDPSSISPILLASLKLPDLNATSYKSMKAYGMHLRCKNVEEHMSASNSGVAAAFDRVYRVGPNDSSTMLWKEEYLGWIEEILELNYRDHCVVVLACKWVKARTTRPNPTVVCDKYGFTSANISERTVVGLGPECFAFPIHV
jgi:hypothetical protein